MKKEKHILILSIFQQGVYVSIKNVLCLQKRKEKSIKFIHKGELSGNWFKLDWFKKGRQIFKVSFFSSSRDFKVHIFNLIKVELVLYSWNFYAKIYHTVGWIFAINRFIALTRKTVQYFSCLWWPARKISMLKSEYFLSGSGCNSIFFSILYA